MNEWLAHIIIQPEEFVALIWHRFFFDTVETIRFSSSHLLLSRLTSLDDGGLISSGECTRIQNECECE